MIKVNKQLNVTWATRDDGTKFCIPKVKNNYEVWVQDKFTGYKFKSLKKALEYCEFGY